MVFAIVLISGVVFPFFDPTYHGSFANHSKKQNDEIPIQIINQMVSTNDPNVVYNYYTLAGGKEIKTKNSYFAHCQIWVKTTISKSFTNGMPRINPDNTYYPGDGFEYSFSYGWEGGKGCRNFKVCPVESSLISGGTGKCDLLKIKTQKSAPRTGAVSSSGEISTDENASGHFIQLTVSAERYFCIYPKNSKVICGWTAIVATGNYSPSVLKPKAGVMITQEFLKDKDGFVSGNMDMTYYLWDAVNLVHNPAYKWKQDRMGTISVVVTKQYDLKLEKEFQCELKLCTQTIVHQGFENWSRNYEYGSGMTLMNATRPDEIRSHQVSYKIELFNLGRFIHKEENKTEILVAKYDPVYSKYPYLVLKDGHAFSWGNRPAIALYYLGSEGGGQDDSQEVHEKRRSKINAYRYSGHAFNPIVKKPLNETLSWSEASQPVSLAEPQCSGINMESNSFERGKTSTAMFVKKGFGKIAFNYPILHTMLGKRYVNATIDNTLQSSNFAGFMVKDLIHYEYRYPDLKFGNPVKILTYGSDGSRTNLTVSVKMVPDVTKGAQYTHDYVCKKIFHDTKHDGFADIVVDDMHDRTNEQNGTGYVNLKSKLTSTWFPEFYGLLASDVLDLELNTGYGAPSPYEITITVGEKTRTIKRIVNFLSPFTHTVNIDADNRLNATSELGIVKILPDEKFGEIIRITINGINYTKDCTNGCTTTILPNHDMKVESWNLWGGHASTLIEAIKTTPNNESYDWNLVMTAAFVAISGWLSHKFGRQAMDYFRNLGT
ncbi:MAG: hypothetical protein ACT4NT_03040 [Nitrososphaerota archaeon]